MKQLPIDSLSENSMLVEPTSISPDINDIVVPITDESVNNEGMMSVSIPEVNVDGALPIDAHANRIAKHIESHQITIIQGETGCGKSSGLPRIIFEHEKKSNRPVKMMVSQPRRIAARALCDRLRSGQNGEVYGLRMGHGERLEDHKTRIWFVTSGYLVQLVAHCSDQLKSHTHLIIDEVHERSVDSDLLCMLARRLLIEHSHLHLIIMSATIHTGLYSEYFCVPTTETLFVGARRFPLTISFVEDLHRIDRMPSHIRRTQSELVKVCELAAKGVKGSNELAPVQQRIAKLQYELVNWLIRTLAAKDDVGAALVFVSGMSDIIALSDILSSNTQTTARILKIFPIHSELPFEQQLEVFVPVNVNEFKVVIATNAAESSLTLPDCDAVICLGTHKLVQHSQDSAAQCQLVNSWIPKSSSTQRAGRTGRVRVGAVYRLYSQELYNAFSDHETPEVKRQPLAQLVLRLRAVLFSGSSHEHVSPFIQELIEPPSMSALAIAFKSLFDIGMISSASDDGTLTQCGRFVAALGVDIRFGRLLSFACVLGVLPQAIIITAALQLPKSPFRLATPLFHDPDEYNDIVAQTVQSRYVLDAGQYSEPLMMLEIYRQYTQQRVDPHARNDVCKQYGLVRSRMQQFDAVVRHLRRRVTSVLGQVSLSSANAGSARNDDGTIIDNSLTTLTNDNSLFLRLILLWTFHDQILSVSKGKNKSYITSVGAVLLESNVKAESKQKQIPSPVVNENSIQRVFRAASSQVSPHLVSTDSTLWHVFLKRNKHRDSGISLSNEAQRTMCRLIQELNIDVCVWGESRHFLLWLKDSPNVMDDAVNHLHLFEQRIHKLGKHNPMVSAVGSKFVIYSTEMLINKTYTQLREHLSEIQLLNQRFMFVFRHDKDYQYSVLQRSGVSMSATQRLRLFGQNARWTITNQNHGHAILFNTVSENNNNTQLNNDTQSRQHCSTIEQCFIDSNSLGVKILASIAAGYRGSPILRLSSSTGVSDQPVVADNALAAQEHDLKIKYTSSMWMMFKTPSGSNTRILLPHCSLFEGAAFSIANRAVMYGVATNVMFIGDNQRLARVSGISLLPGGSRFLILALSCAQIDTDGIILRYKKNKLKNSMDIAIQLSENLSSSVHTMQINNTQIQYDIMSLFSFLYSNESSQSHDVESTHTEQQQQQHVVTPQPQQTMSKLEKRQISVLKNINKKVSMSDVRAQCKEQSKGNTQYKCIACKFHGRWDNVFNHMTSKKKCVSQLQSIVNIESSCDISEPSSNSIVSTTTGVTVRPKTHSYTVKHQNILTANEMLLRDDSRAITDQSIASYMCEVCSALFECWNDCFLHMLDSVCTRKLARICTTVNTPSKKKVKSKKGYACLACFKLFSVWIKCWQHLNSECLSDMIKLQSKQDVSMKSTTLDSKHYAIKTTNKNGRNVIQYQCSHCYLITTWTACRIHMLESECAPYISKLTSATLNTKNLQRDCRDAFLNYCSLIGSHQL